MTIEAGGAVSLSPKIATKAPEFRPAPDSFAATIAPLGILPKSIKGNVLIVGHGPNFFEKSLLSPNVRSKTLVDSVSEPYSVSVFERHPDEHPHLNKNTVNYYQWSLERALSGIKRPVFDSAMFFRSINLQGQFPQVLAAIGRVLMPGKRFVGSGGFENLETIERMVDGQFGIEKLVLLPNPDFGRYYHHAHVGFVLKKGVD